MSGQANEYYIKTVVKKEAGYDEAMEGLSYNKKKDPKDMIKVAEKLAPMGNGHNKFLEQIKLWITVEAPLYWWSEADTYRLTTKQSESTMHTLVKDIKDLIKNMCSTYTIDSQLLQRKLYCSGFFEEGSVSMGQLESIINSILLEEPIWKIKQKLPAGFIQKRMWTMDYKTLLNIKTQRHNHRLPHWQKFLADVESQIEHPEFLVIK